MLLARVLLLAIGSCVFGQDRDSRIVNTEQGPVRGYKDEESGLFIFYNIPYATAPTGSDKFKAPLPPPQWTTPYEATNKNVICPQTKTKNVLLRPFLKMQEDCLIANIYVPDTAEGNLPINVHIHGGAFQIGYGDMVQQKNILKQKKFIFVSFNYRLGANGFLCLGTKDIPGNAGLKDQLALLRWVKKNIAGFGGNPDDVTLSGDSAGASSVDLLMLSKTTDGLFNKVIPESGANIAPWSVQMDPLENAKYYAKELNFSDFDDVYALEKFYKTASYDLIYLSSVFSRPDNTFFFTPCIERNIGEERIIDDTPLNILKEGRYKKIPMLYGFANMKGISRVVFGYDQWKDKINERFSDFLPADLKFDTEEQREEVAKNVRDFYFGNKAINDDTIVSFIDCFSDILFVHPVLRAIKLHIEAGHDAIYLYEYSFPDLVTPMTPKVLEKVKGASHVAQAFAVADGVGVFGDESNIPEDYKRMKSVMRELWINLITTGKPVPERSSFPTWSPVASTDGSPYMHLNKTLELRSPLLKERVQFWDDIYERHYTSRLYHHCNHYLIMRSNYYQENDIPNLLYLLSNLVKEIYNLNHWRAILIPLFVKPGFISI